MENIQTVIRSNELFPVTLTAAPIHTAQLSTPQPLHALIPATSPLTLEDGTYGLIMHRTGRGPPEHLTPDRNFFSTDPRAPAPANPSAYPSFPPPPPGDLLAKRTHYETALRQREYAASNGAEDTPTFALYHLYEHFVVRDTFGILNELERFFYNKRPVKSIPDPEDFAEPARHAVLTYIPALMVESFNERNKIGILKKANPFMTREEFEAYKVEERIYKELPEWTKRAKPLDEALMLLGWERLVLDHFEDTRAIESTSWREERSCSSAVFSFRMVENVCPTTVELQYTTSSSIYSAYW